ncbi:helical backbone metal receptor [Zoogloea sp.]|jgi:ABC-type Fe3+-hydroxamate transport system substrate-binding protein|uniref:helical backbone metal receptor n=1 Tax=Zoogloea sp. TaxID=49181 RepID=UPI001E05C958|nr:helical backbone metal receptor [Zoogloea sp.]MBK6655794.1 ABC transporter substrate-binding protein [Zoogloea sp.]MBK7847529.1 ABC transporter substrate-binding protein [Zoogloea sp.]HPI59676.1 helical backbone metal receptor [Zoogloea sp.]
MTINTLGEVLIDAAGQRHAPYDGPARIVSLVPSLTELVCDLGLAPQLVGRTGFCIHPAPALKTVTKVGGTKDVNLARLRALAPTHIIVNVDENRRECVEEIATFVPNVIVTHPCAPEDNVPVYRLMGAIFGRRAESERLVTALEAALAEARALGAALPRERVLYLIWREPWMTVAQGTYIAAMLATVGWDTCPALSEPRYPAFEWNTAPWLSEVRRVLLSSEPYRFRERHLEEVRHLSGQPSSLIDGEMASWYGSRAIDGLRYLAALRRSLAAE